MATFSDLFNRANETPLNGSGWAPIVTAYTGAGLNLASNAAVAPATGLNCYTAVTTAALTAQRTQFASVILAARGTGFQGIGPAVHLRGGATGGNGFTLQYVAGTEEMVLMRRSSNFEGYSTVATVYQPCVDGDVLRLEAIDEGVADTVTLKMYRNGAQVGTNYTGAWLTANGAGQPGVFCEAGAVGIIDGFSGGDVAVVGTPTITDVDTDEGIAGTQTGVIATVTNAGASQGSSVLEIISGATAVAQTITSWADASITFTTVLGALRYTSSAVTHALRLTTSAGQGSIPISISPPAGKSFVTLTSQNTGVGSITAAGNFTGTFTPGMQVEFPTTNSFAVLPDGTCTASAAGTYNCRANDGSGWVAFDVVLTSGSGDTTAPNLTAAIAIASITQTTASFSATPDEGGVYGIAILPAAASTTGIEAAVLAGTASGAVWSRSSTSMSAGVAITASLSGMTAGQSYKPVIVLRDTATTPNTRMIVGSNFTMQSAGGGDTTAPNLTAAIAITSITQTTANFSATPDEGGVYGIAIVPAAASTTGIEAAVLAGTVSGAVWSRSSTAMTANVAISGSLNGLTAGQSYKPVIVLRDNASTPNTRMVVGSNFTMQAAGGGDTQPPTITLGVVSAPPVHQFTAVPADNVGVVGVQFYLNGSPVGAELTSGPWTFQWSEAGQPAGTYAFTARARDAAGLNTLSSSVQVVVASSGGPSLQPLATGGAGNYEPVEDVWVRVQEGR